MDRAMRGRHSAAVPRRPVRARPHRSDAAALRPWQQMLAAVVTCVLAAASGAGAVVALNGDGARSSVPALATRLTGATPAGTDATRRTVDGEVLDLLVAHYYRSVDPTALQGTRLDRLPAVLGDRYTHYLKPEAVSAVELSDSGTYTGIGVVLAAEPPRATGAGTVRVTSVLPGSPADRAGIHPGDVVTEVAGTPTAGIPLADVLAALRGRPGTRVRLAVGPTGRVRSVLVSRALLRDTVVSSRLVTPADGPAFGYVTVSEFDEGTGDQVRAAVTEVRRTPARALVLDLRGNPGGLVDEAVDVVSAFVPPGSPVFAQRGQHVSATTTRTGRPAVSAGQPVVVLVDEATASSGEIVAGALRDDVHAVLVGARTFGKGVIQRTWPVEDGALKITVAEYLTPAGHPVDRVGLAPDVVLPDPAAPVETLGPLVRSVLAGR